MRRPLAVVHPQPMGRCGVGLGRRCRLLAVVFRQAQRFAWALAAGGHLLVQ